MLFIIVGELLINGSCVSYGNFLFVLTTINGSILTTHVYDYVTLN